MFEDITRVGEVLGKMAERPEIRRVQLSECKVLGFCVCWKYQLHNTA